MALADLDHPLGEVEQRARLLLLCLDVDGLVAVDRVHDHGEVEAAGIAGGEAGVAVRGPLHRRTDPVAVAQPDVVAHADLVAVVHHGRAGQAEQQRREQLDLVAVVVEQRRQAAADADVRPHPGVLGVLGVHVVALFVGHHLERELVVVTQEDAPLAVLGDLGRLGQDLRDRIAGLASYGHEDARHQREVEGHVALVAAGDRVAEVLHHVGRPLVGLREQDPVGVEPVHLGPDPLEIGVGLRQVLAVGALLLEQVGDGVEPETVDAEVEPESDDLHHRVLHVRVLVVEVRLMMEEAVPVVLAAYGVVGPVGRLGVDEDDPGVRVLLVGVAPDVEVAVRTVGVGARGLEPRVLVAGVVHDEVGDHSDAALVRLVDQADEVPQVAELREDLHIVGNVVSAVPEGRLVQRQQPQAVDAEPLEIVELVDEPADVPGAVPVGVGETPDQHFVEDGSFEPVLIPRLLVRECVRDGLAVAWLRCRAHLWTPRDVQGRAHERCADPWRSVKMCAGLMCGSRRT